MTPAPGPDIRIFEDRESLAGAAADRIVQLAGIAVTVHDRFTVAFSGGTTPRRLYEILGSSPHRDSIDWKRVHAFWADERCVPGDHEESNFKFLSDTLLSKVPIPERNIHRVRGEEGPEQAALHYEQELRSFFGGTATPVFDLIILGAGEDGHTASLFPGSAELLERSRLAVPVHLDAPKLDRVTLTLPVLNHAAQVLVLAAGRAKTGVVREIMENNNSRSYPAGLVRPEKGVLTWFIDQEAAGRVGRAMAT